MKFRKILKEIIGDRLNELLAESKIDNLKKLGLNDDNSNIVFGIFKGISVIFAKKLIDKFMQEYNVDRQEAVRNINNTNYFSRMLEKMISIKDYIDVEFRGTNIESLKELSFDQIYQKSVEWHENIEKGEAQINYKENENNVIIDFRKNGEGFYWVDLKTKNSRDECKRMGHCGRSEYGNLYSFREYKNLSKKGYTSNESHLTAAIDIEDGILYQLKGAKNSKPLPRFHPYILALLNYKNYGDYLIKEIKSEYDGRNDFKIWYR
jgi:hypothetical protein